jgi:hypothetical protein
MFIEDTSMKPSKGGSYTYSYCMQLDTVNKSDIDLLYCLDLAQAVAERLRQEEYQKREI